MKTEYEQHHKLLKEKKKKNTYCGFDIASTLCWPQTLHNATVEQWIQHGTCKNEQQRNERVIRVLTVLLSGRAHTHAKKIVMFTLFDLGLG